MEAVTLLRAIHLNERQNVDPLMLLAQRTPLTCLEFEYKTYCRNPKIATVLLWAVCV